MIVTFISSPNIIDLFSTHLMTEIFNQDNTLIKTLKIVKYSVNDHRCFSSLLISHTIEGPYYSKSVCICCERAVVFLAWLQFQLVFLPFGLFLKNCAESKSKKPRMHSLISFPVTISDRFWPTFSLRCSWSFFSALLCWLISSRCIWIICWWLCLQH